MVQLRQFTPNWKVLKLPNKNAGFKKIVEGLLENSSCAGPDGTLSIHVLGQWYRLRPKKKKKDEE